ncbi:MAG: MarR family transcriptional regulator [Isosphaeraceae bacterium]
MGPGKLGREIGKRRPFGDPREEALLNLLRTHDQVQIRLTRLFRDFGLTPSQYNVLRILRGEGTPLPILEIASRTVTVVPGITGLIDRLERAGLVRRERCSEDRRVIHVALTEGGTDLLGRLDRPLADLQSRVLAHMTVAELKTLSRLLEKVRESAAGDPS